MARTVVTQELITKINDLYLEIGTYAGVSRALGGSPPPTTVKKYIIKDYKKVKEIKKTEFHKEDLPEFTGLNFVGIDNYGDICVLSEKEKDEIKELWKEILI